MSSQHLVSAEIVATVQSIEASIGQSVTATDTLVLLDSMKMEIPVLAEVPGVVSEILVSQGDQVHDGDPIAKIDKTA